MRGHWRRAMLVGEGGCGGPGPDGWGAADEGRWVRGFGPEGEARRRGGWSGTGQEIGAGAMPLMGLERASAPAAVTAERRPFWERGWERLRAGGFPK